jgi:glycosyltransferase involved in cell wall biosynthesis
MSDAVLRNDVDVVHTHMSSAHFFGVLLRHIAGVPSVATAHSRQFQLHWTFNDRVIGCCKATCEYQRRVNRVHRTRLETIHNFPDTERFQRLKEPALGALRSSLGISASDVVIGYVGDIIPRKGLIFLLKAVAEIVRGRQDVRLLVVGNGNCVESYRRQVEEAAAHHRLQDVIHWLGLRSDTPQLMSLMDLLALPSLEESMPMAILEAMSIGLPVVASNVGGIAEAVENEETGIVVPAKNTVALAAALGRLVDNPDLRREMSERTRCRIETHFSPEVQARKTLEVLQSAALMGRRKRLGTASQVLVKAEN